MKIPFAFRPIVDWNGALHLRSKISIPDSGYIVAFCPDTVFPIIRYFKGLPDSESFPLC